MCTQLLSRKLCFKTTDQNGVTVALEKECWYGPILREHKRQMNHRLHDIKTTIEKPDRVDDYFVKRIRNSVYFKRWKGIDPFGQEYLKVPSQIVGEGDPVFRVLTAHPMFMLPPKQRETK